MRREALADFGAGRAEGRAEMESGSDEGGREPLEVQRPFIDVLRVLVVVLVVAKSADVRVAAEPTDKVAAVDNKLGPHAAVYAVAVAGEPASGFSVCGEEALLDAVGFLVGDVSGVEGVEGVDGIESVVAGDPEKPEVASQVHPGHPVHAPGAGTGPVCVELAAVNGVGDAAVVSGLHGYVAPVVAHLDEQENGVPAVETVNGVFRKRHCHGVVSVLKLRVDHGNCVVAHQPSCDSRGSPGVPVDVFGAFKWIVVALFRSFAVLSPQNLLCIAFTHNAQKQPYTNAQR